MNLKLEIEGLQSDIDKLERKVHSLEVKTANLNVAEELGRLVKKVASLEEWISTVGENWMRRVDSLLEQVPKLFNDVNYIAEMIENLNNRLTKIESIEESEDETKDH